LRANLDLDIHRKDTVVVTFSDSAGFLRKLIVSSNGFVRCHDHDGNETVIKSVHRKDGAKRK